MPKLRRLFVVTILLGAAITGLAMGARWTGSESDSGAAIEPAKPAAQYISVQAAAKGQTEIDSSNSYNWALYTGVSALTGLYIMARIIGARKRGKNNHLR